MARRLIAARINDGYKEDDFIEVNRKMTVLWKGNPRMEHCLNYETLYGPKFEKYAGLPEMTSGDSSNQKNQQDYSKGVDEDGNW